ncbi:MAG: serine/threonine protein kinase, partial [Planctomycetes bacterium]|nr:serine/threonine protein kinase [Planctomycetota bacterium]
MAIHEVGEHRSRQFFSMDYIDGLSLAQYSQNVTLSSLQSAALVREIALAVQAAHDQGILHRDLKPSNVLIDAEGQPHVADFGLAKRIDGESEWTATGQIVGTPSYMSPEQALGRIRELTFASDIYALGAILYELLAARPPFQGESTVETIRQLLDDEPVSLRHLKPSVSRDLETICLKCLEKQPQQRYQTARELAEELDRVIHDEPIRARPLGALPRGWRWCRRNPASALALLLVCVLAIAGPTAAIYVSGLLRRAQVAERNRTDAEIHALRTSAPAAVPQIVSGLHRDWERVRPQLVDLWRDPKLTPSDRTRVSVALAQEGQPYAGHAFEQLLVVDADEDAVVEHLDR